MENLEEKDEHKKTESGIKKERLNALKGNYQKPEIVFCDFRNKDNGDCSDMMSLAGCPSCHTTKACTNNVKLA